MDRPNLTVLTHALVTRLTFAGARATGVEISYGGKTRRIAAESEVVLSLGAINTPKVLMQSGIGDQAELHRLGIPVVQHLPGVGQNFQDHPAFGCVWGYQEAWARRSSSGRAIRCVRQSEAPRERASNTSFRGRRGGREYKLFCNSPHEGLVFPARLLLPLSH
jgi:choline dehydrogenase-like flavoprotein